MQNEDDNYNHYADNVNLCNARNDNDENSK